MIKIESGAYLEVSKLIIDTVKVGYKSKLEIYTFSTSVFHIHVYYNSSQVNHNVVPLAFNIDDNFQLNNTDIQFFNINQGAFLEEKENQVELEAKQRKELFVTANFISPDQDNNLNACKSIKFISSLGFGDPECIDENRYQKKINLYVYRERTQNKNGNKKKGLSTGAIVGIVIAVVAVIAIIVLCLYFFVFRKKAKVGISNST